MDLEILTIRQTISDKIMTLLYAKVGVQTYFCK